ncbi:hypothetical protein [Hydrogenophaga crocea]|uniref:Uncharacterized protein n=1 Tax=Hydrogenophaga crocea TaxID=2716225 RepID=A0A6G8IFC2_9BURK|nr:hypothetical protein [Hydrogenophaga crocea]QIM51758.1 hypothetical protein G9Q37_06175 [Hydrogenophaga crocea]
MRTFEAGTQQVLQRLQLVARPRAHVGHRAAVGDQFRTLLPEVAVAQPSMVLATGVDDPTDRLVRHTSGRLVYVASAEVGGPTVDQDGAGWRYHQSDVGIQGFVLFGASAQITDMDIHPFGDFFEPDLRGRTKRWQQAEQKPRHQRNTTPGHSAQNGRR